MRPFTGWCWWRFKRAAGSWRRAELKDVCVSCGEDEDQGEALDSQPQWRATPTPASLMNERWQINKVTWVVIKDNFVPWTGLCPCSGNFVRYATFWFENWCEGEFCASIPMWFLSCDVWLRRNVKVIEGSCCITLQPAQFCAQKPPHATAMMDELCQHVWEQLNTVSAPGDLSSHSALTPTHL